MSIEKMIKAALAMNNEISEESLKVRIPNTDVEFLVTAKMVNTYAFMKEQNILKNFAKFLVCLAKDCGEDYLYAPERIAALTSVIAYYLSSGDYVAIRLMGTQFSNYGRYVFSQMAFAKRLYSPLMYVCFNYDENLSTQDIIKMHRNIKSLAAKKDAVTKFSIDGEIKRNKVTSKTVDIAVNNINAASNEIGKKKRDIYLATKIFAIWGFTIDPYTLGISMAMYLKYNQIRNYIANCNGSNLTAPSSSSSAAVAVEDAKKDLTLFIKGILLIANDELLNIMSQVIPTHYNVLTDEIKQHWLVSINQNKSTTPDKLKAFWLSLFNVNFEFFAVKSDTD